MADKIPNPIYPITRYDVFRTLPDLGILDPADVTFKQHVDKLLQYSSDKDPANVWRDFFKHTDGRTVLEWVAGMSALTQYNQLIGVREEHLDTAMSLSGVTEAAFDRGYLIGPSIGGTVRLTMGANSDPVIIQKGQVIGSVNTYDLIALNSYVIDQTTQVMVDCLVGYQSQHELPISGLMKFKTFRIKPTGRYVSSQMESLLVDDVSVELTTLPSPDRTVENNFMIRRWANGLITLYTGNGVLGYTNEDATSMVYSCVSYDTDLVDKITQSPQLYIDVFVSQYQVLTLPAMEPDKEEIRNTAIYYAPDGKLVQDGDYSNHIVKNFGGMVYDVIDYNTDPDQEIIILKSPNFGTGSVEENNLTEIINSVDNRRGMGIKVNFYLKDPNEGIEWRPSFYVPANRLTVDLSNRVDAFLAGRILKMFPAAQTISVIALASELSSLFQVKFVPFNKDETQEVPFLGYFTSWTADLRPDTE